MDGYDVCLELLKRPGSVDDYDCLNMFFRDLGWDLLGEVSSYEYEPGVLLKIHGKNGLLEISSGRIRHTDYQRSRYTEYQSFRYTSQPMLPVPVSLRFLRAFAWFCGPQSKKDVFAALRDINLDDYGMQAEGRGKVFRACVITFRSVIGTALPIACDGIVRLLKPVKAAKEIGK